MQINTPSQCDVRRTERLEAVSGRTVICLAPCPAFRSGEVQSLVFELQYDPKVSGEPVVITLQLARTPKAGVLEPCARPNMTRPPLIVLNNEARDIAEADRSRRPTRPAAANHADPSGSDPATGSDGVAASASNARIVIVADDRCRLAALEEILVADGHALGFLPTGAALMAELQSLEECGLPICILLDANLIGMSSLDVLERLQARESSMSVVVMAGRSDMTLAIRAMKSGAVDCIERPFDAARVRQAVCLSLCAATQNAIVKEQRQNAQRSLAGLTAREMEVLHHVLRGHPNKNIAADLGISQRTVESHRASVMTKSGCRTLPELVRLAVTASSARPKR